MAESDYSGWVTRQTLLEKIRDQKDDKSWEDFVYYYEKYIYNIVRRMNLNHHDAEEITQNVMVKLWKKLPEFRYDPEKGRFRGWICRVTGNEVKDFFRKQNKRSQDQSVDAEEEKPPPQLLSIPEIEDLAEQEWRSYASKLAWKNIEDGLDEKSRKVFLMFLDGESAEVIAEETGLTPKSTYVYKQRVQDRLRDEIVRLNRELL